ncbi:MAG: aspartyl/asparaginyl beta-hydroxylase domain-containing protein, partial [Casimicrobiaceae bacterium]
MSAGPGGMQTAEEKAREIAELEGAAVHAMQNGREPEAVKLWARILDLEPTHARTMTALGQRAFRLGDMASARAMFQRIVDADGRDPQQWIHLAVACRNQKDEAGEEHAIRRALEQDPRELVALILRADLLERQGKSHQAAAAHRAVAAVSPSIENLRPELRAAVAKAYAQTDQYNRDFGAFMDRHLESTLKDFAGEDLKRFRDSVDIMVGRKRRFDSQSVMFHYPGLPAIEFFERADFPWLDTIEAATDAIRDEFLAVLASEEGFTPYISYPNDVPQNQFAELNNSPRWSAFHLWKSGVVVGENAARCPVTMSALEGAPKPEQAGRTPAAMFSLLKPKTRIPPHNGVTNVRLVTHLPLIVPDGCRFRVGNDIRQWVPGKAWVFDDTIEHEAWNDSDKLRVVLIFDIWNPLLTPPERALITAMAAGVNA